MSLKNSNIAFGLVKAINNVENPKKKEATDEYGNTFSYAPLDEVVKVIKKALDPHGMAVVQPFTTGYQILPNGFEIGVITVKTQIIHESGEVLEFDSVTFKSNGNTAQMMGSANTYARRYSLMSIFGIAGEEDDDGRIASLHGVNMGRPDSIPENPNKKGEEKQQKEQEDNKKSDLIDEQQSKELLSLAEVFSELKETTVDGVLGAFGGLDNLTQDKFELTKNKLIEWIEKAKAESNQEKSEESKDDKKEPSDDNKEDPSSEKKSAKGSAVFTVVSKEERETQEGTPFYEVSVEGTKTPMFAKVEVGKNLNIGDKFLGYYSKKGNKVTLEKVEETQPTLV